jgi:hypothetical protein
MFDEYTVKRRTAGSYVDGTWAPGTESEFTIQASVQPTKPDELINLPEAQRTSAAMKVYTNTILRTANEASAIQADCIVVDEEDWEIQKIDKHALGMAHFKAIAVRKDRA